MIRRLALLLLPLALGSCTAPEVAVQAYAEGGHLAFRVAPDQRDTANCFVYFDIVDAKGQRVWGLVSDWVSGPAESCPKVFPLRYGVAPHGVQAAIAPARLVRGQLYVIQGHATGTMIGAFRIGADDKVEQVDPESAEAKAAMDIYWREQTVRFNASDPEPEANATAN